MSVIEIKEVLQNCMDRAVDENEVAGCTFCLIRNGEEKLYLESGYADREAEKPIARDSMYRMYSMSKPVTAAAAMKLIEDGYVDLQDPVFRPVFLRRRGNRAKFCLCGDGFPAFKLIAGHCQMVSGAGALCGIGLPVVRESRFLLPQTRVLRAPG